MPAVSLYRVRLRLPKTKTVNIRASLPQSSQRSLSGFSMASGHRRVVSPVFDARSSPALAQNRWRLAVQAIAVSFPS
jgi:hypothetical protein